MATPRVAAGALFADAAGRVLLVKPTYKSGWDIPGGYVTPGESPLAACRRELVEELGRTWPVRPQPLVVDWAPARHEGDKILFVFGGGILPGDALGSATFPDGEISDIRLVEPQEFDDHLPDRLARRLRLALRAREQHRTIYAEHGTEVGPAQYA
ncbi:NUDIX hydrolase [Natronosporangium hydrolyticum]|uniref:NUDIX hydrolase n=1 Tax=Natronosporangium hydrolyticum TaxID=2811111 RepID=A0A895YPW6_9ACTN|nr:NUDIX hydrolase [Natronosporangium hydrolyticum]